MQLPEDAVPLSRFGRLVVFLRHLCRARWVRVGVCRRGSKSSSRQFVERLAPIAHGHAEAALEKRFRRRGVLPAAGSGDRGDRLVRVAEPPLHLLQPDAQHRLVDAFALQLAEAQLDYATAGLSFTAASLGASMVRVHNVAQSRMVLDTFDSSFYAFANL